MRVEYIARLIRLVLGLLVWLLLFVCIALLPALLISLGEKNAAMTTLAGAQASGAGAERATLESWFGQLRQKLTILTPPKIEPEPYENFEKVINAETAGSSVTSLTWSTASSGSTLEVKGTSPDRDTLLKFQNSLSATGGFSQVSFPVANLAKDANLNFEFTLTPQ